MANKDINEQRREDILKRIRPHIKVRDLELINAEADSLLQDSINARPPLPADNPADAFFERIQSGRVIGTQCQRIASLTELPEAVSELLLSQGLNTNVALQPCPLLNQLNWDGFMTTLDLRHDNGISICVAECGIAETGSLIIRSSNTMPILLNFLPQYLIAVVFADQIYPYMDDFALAENHAIAQGNDAPRNLCMISGASGTTDIEGVLVQGAHGPERVFVYMVEKAIVVER